MSRWCLKNSMSFIFGTGSVSSGGTYIKRLDGPSLQEMLLDEDGDVLGLDLLVEDAVGMDHDDRALFAETVTARRDDEDLVLELPFPDLLFEGVLDPERPAGNASGPGANQ